jgi:transcriptional regulator
MTNPRIDLPQGTLDLLILKTLDMGPQHGWAISERIRHWSNEALHIQQGSMYPSLHRLERKGLLKVEWGTTHNNRKAKYYELTRTGRRKLEAETDAWRQLTGAVGQILDMAR